MLRGHQLGDLTGHPAQTKARELRPSLTTAGSVARDQVGIRVGRLDGHDVHMSWEDVALIIMGPRSNKTSALAVPAVRAAPGLAVATSNKADLWALTSGSRAELGPVWVFDPQDIAYHPQQWWWDPLRAIREVPDPHRVEAATRLAGHFMATIGGTRRDPFFHAAGEQVLTGTLLAAALDPTASLRDVIEWLQHGRRDAIIALDTAGAETEAADLHAALSGADVTAKGIFQTARTATKALTSQRILRWVTPPHTWREPGPDLPELDPWTDPRPHPLDAVSAVQRRRGHRRPHRGRDRRPPPRHRRTHRPSPRRHGSTHPWSPCSTRPRTSAPSASCRSCTPTTAPAASKSSPCCRATNKASASGATKAWTPSGRPPPSNSSAPAWTTNPSSPACPA